MLTLTNEGESGVVAAARLVGSTSADVVGLLKFKFPCSSDNGNGGGGGGGGAGGGCAWA